MRFAIIVKAVVVELAKYHEELKKAGVLLEASSQELVAGYTVIQVRSRDEALEWSRRFPMPSLAGCEVEVREMEDA